jgi:serine/threonine protein kinase
MGVQEIHKLGSSHRDIKPSNILFNKNLLPKLIDYGLLGPPICNPSMGTRKYASPGVFTGTDSFSYVNY